MRQIKDEAGKGNGQAGHRGFPTPGCRCSGAAVSLFRRIGVLVLVGLLGVPAVARQPAGDRQRKTGAEGAPLLLVTQTEIDLGQVPKGSSAEARFELRNAGNADLRVLDVQSGCACTIATYDELIPPGGVGYVTATLLTETLNGQVGQGISLATNDPTSPSITLVVRAEVVTAVRILPERAIVLRNQPGEMSARRVIRRQVSSGHGFFSIAGLKTSAPWVVAGARKVREAAPASEGLPAVTPGDWILEVLLDGQPVYGHRSEQVEFKTGLARQPLVRLEVRTELLAPVQVAVDRLFLQPGGEEAAETLSIVVREGLDPSALVVDALPDGLTVQLESGAGQLLTARVRWQGGRLEKGQLVFHIAGERFELPVLFEPQR